MNALFHLNLQALTGQLLVGLVNGSFYAILSLGLAVIFGLLRVINFAHGANYMMGAMLAYLLFVFTGASYWTSLYAAPLLVGGLAFMVERRLIRPLYTADPLFNLLLTFGLALLVEGGFRYFFGSSGAPYAVPELLRGSFDLGVVVLPVYRVWVVFVSAVVCAGVWLIIERTRVGGLLRAATENAALVQVFGINVPLLKSITFAFGAGLAGLAGVLAAPIYQVSPLMGVNIIIVTFAIVVIGGMGSIAGAIVSGYLLGLIEALTKIFYPEASTIIIFAVMGLVLLIRPSGLLGTIDESRTSFQARSEEPGAVALGTTSRILLLIASVILLAVLPSVIYPVVIMKVLCFALFACSFNLLLGYLGLLSFGHAAFFGGGAYVVAYLLKDLEWNPEYALATAVFVAAALGLIMSYFALRRSGIYFSMITLALAQMFYFVCLQAPITNGEDGIQGVPRGALFGMLSLENAHNLYFVVLALCIGGILLLWRVANSPFGLVLQSIKDDERRVTSLGYDVNFYKTVAFVLSAAMAGLAGGLKAIVFQLASLSDVQWQMSGEAILMTLMGGLGTVFGPAFGAAVVITIESVFAGSVFPVTIVTGAIFILCVLFFRRGLFGEAIGYLSQRRQTAMKGAERRKFVPATKIEG